MKVPLKYILESFYDELSYQDYTKDGFIKRLTKMLEGGDYYICRMSGGKHGGYCPTCGCEPQ